MTANCQGLIWSVGTWGANSHPLLGYAKSGAPGKYEFTVQIAPQGIAEYEYWERHEGWNGHRIWEETKKGGRACRRNAEKKIVWVSPGLVFPILGAVSEFVEERGPSEWVITKPTLFKPEEMIAKAVSQFRSVNGDPMQMGRSAGVYDRTAFLSKNTG